MAEGSGAPADAQKLILSAPPIERVVDMVILTMSIRVT